MCKLKVTKNNTAVKKKKKTHMPVVLVSYCVYLLEYVGSAHISKVELVFRHLIMWLYVEC